MSYSYHRLWDQEPDKKTEKTKEVNYKKEKEKIFSCLQKLLMINTSLASAPDGKFEYRSNYQKLKNDTKKVIKDLIGENQISLQAEKLLQNEQEKREHDVAYYLLRIDKCSAEIQDSYKRVLNEKDVIMQGLKKIREDIQKLAIRLPDKKADASVESRPTNKPG